MEQAHLSASQLLFCACRRCCLSWMAHNLGPWSGLCALQALLLAGAVRVCSSWLREGKARRQERPLQPFCFLAIGP